MSPVGKKYFRICTLVFIIIVLVGCTFESNLYVAFMWSDGEKPDSTFSSNIPNVPDDIDSIAYGGNFLTFPGTYSLSYSYISGETKSFSFTLEEDTAVLGREFRYYHIYLTQDTEPYMLKYPY